jgi:hypothetical protein
LKAPQLSSKLPEEEEDDGSEDTVGLKGVAKVAFLNFSGVYLFVTYF